MVAISQIKQDEILLFETPEGSIVLENLPITASTAISMLVIAPLVYGMTIKMYFQQREHNPPHFHVVYGEFVGVIEIESLQMIEGDLPGKALALAREWAETNKKELLLIWNTQNFIKLPPLL
jgi:hypothetical protein